MNVDASSTEDLQLPSADSEDSGNAGGNAIVAPVVVEAVRENWTGRPIA